MDFCSSTQNFPFHLLPQYLSAKLSPSCALGLLVALGQCPVAGAQPLAGSVVDLHGDALGGSLLGEGLGVARVAVAGLPVAQEVFEPCEKLGEFSVSGNMNSEQF